MNNCYEIPLTATLKVQLCLLLLASAAVNTTVVVFIGKLCGDFIVLGICVTFTSESTIESELSATVGKLKVTSLYGLPASVNTSKSAGHVIVGGVLSISEKISN